MKKVLVAILVVILFACSNKEPDYRDYGVIYLRFNGYHSKIPLYAGQTIFPGSNLTDREKQMIIERVSYYFQDFKVRVTDDDSIFYNTPPNHRVHCVVSEFQYPDAAGYSLQNQLSIGDTTAAMVSSATLHYVVEDISRAICHEIGHSLGLAHQSAWVGAFRSSIYDEGNSSVSPIMGNPYYSEQAIWTVGYNMYGQLQDDTAIIGKTFHQK